MSKDKKEKVICNKCGAESDDPKGNCPHCGEYLYHYYLEEKKEKTLKNIALFGLPIIIIALAIAGWLAYSKATYDPVKVDLENYLKDIVSGMKYFNETDIKKEYNRKVHGYLNPNEEEYIFNKYGHLPTSEVEKIYESESKRIKGRTSVKEKYRIRSEYAKMKFSTLKDKVPITEPAEEIHSHLVKHLEYQAKAYDSLYRGIELDYIFDVTELNGMIQWKYYPKDIDKRKYSDDYALYVDKSEQEWNLFESKLTKLKKQKKLEGKALWDFVDIILSLR